jgi:ribosomal protein L11 methyltransferase
VLFYYRIDKAIAVGSPWWRFVVSRAPIGILLKYTRTFPPYHPTTKMCLRLMLQDLKGRCCQDLVDVGCGSGILALAGLKLGVVSAVAVDIDRQAVITSRANAELNHLLERLLLVRGSADAVAGCFDLVLANLPMPVLIEKLPELSRLSKAGGSLVLSGFQDLDRLLLEKELGRQGLTANRWLSMDLTFFGVPPSGSFTWMAVHASQP